MKKNKRVTGNARKNMLEKKPLVEFVIVRVIKKKGSLKRMRVKPRVMTNRCSRTFLSRFMRERRIAKAMKVMTLIQKKVTLMM